MWCAARHCAFESHPLRQSKQLVDIRQAVFFTNTTFVTRIAGSRLAKKTVLDSGVV